MEVFSRRNRCMSALDGVKPPKPQLSRTPSYDPNSSKPIPTLSLTTDCSRVVCGRKTAAPGQGQYNKWFIPPSHRLKRSVPTIKLDKSSDEFFYRQLFHADYPDPLNPFQRVLSDKLAKFQKIPRKGISLIEQFRKCQLVRRRRVPQIVEMLFDHVSQRQSK